jgi:hypothetical protein
MKIKREFEKLMNSKSFTSASSKSLADYLNQWNLLESFSWRNIFLRVNEIDRAKLEI